MKRNYPLWKDASEADRHAIYEVYVKNFYKDYDLFDDEPMAFEEFNEYHQFDTFRSVKHYYTGEWK